MNILSYDNIQYICDFLQRTDQISLKLTNKYMAKNIINLMDSNVELLLYIKTIDQLDYAWKNDTRYINIKTLDNLKKKLPFLHKHAILTNLWYFDFNAEFDITFPFSEYVILFLTTVSDYTINLEFADCNGNITKTSHIPIRNKIFVKFNSFGKVKINCNETKKIKTLKTVQYIMCVPLYYWNIFTENNNKKIQYWRKQICVGTDGQTILVKNFY